MANVINKSLPMMLDQYTELFGIQIMPGRTIVYQNRLARISHNLFDVVEVWGAPGVAAGHVPACWRPKGGGAW